MTFSPAQLELAGGEVGFINYELVIPADSALDGSYWGAIAINKAATEGEITKRIETPQDDSRFGVGIKLQFEYVVIVYATIEGTENKSATFETITAEAHEGKIDIKATFENLGNVYLKPQVWMEVMDAAGQIVLKTEIVKQVVLPQDKQDFAFAIDQADMSPGEYLVMVIADYGVPQMIAAQARINITEQPEPAPEPASAPAAGGAAGDGGEPAPEQPGLDA